MKIETWKCDNGLEEIHHFVEGEQNTYLFGFNEQLLGIDLYNEVKKLVQQRLDEEPWRLE